MRLSALQLLGFKSFPDKTELRFEPGITAIVGPNGSGKSNIVDAIRWVLGEQSSRALRSPRTPDLIFNGTATRKPLGMAQVTLLLDNTDESLPLPFSEVAVTRRVYRSGESEFLINGEPVRLKDIHDLFLGTGLGKGGMAVVGQGEVDSVLSAHPQDRRALLEETAGTSRYQAQKREAVQKLGQAQADLERVRDLVAELSARAQDLSVQAEAAARWRELSAALRQHQTARVAREWIAASQRWERGAEQLAAARASLDAAERELAAAEAAAEERRAELARAETDLEDARQALALAESRRAELVHGLELAEVQAAGIARQLAGIEADRKRRTQEQQEAARRVEELASQIAAQEAAVLAWREQAAAQERELAAYEAQHQEVAVQLEQARAEVIEVLQRLAHFRNELRRLDGEIKGEHARRERLGAALAALATERDAAKAALAEAEAASAAHAARLHEHKSRAEAAQAALAGLRQALTEARRSVDQIRAQLSEVRATRQALERLEESHAGYQPAVKAVLGAAPPLPGLVGTVAQLLVVPARVETAIHVALGASLQYLVMADEQAVQRAIDFLKARRAGRATFLALETLRGRPWPAEHADVLRTPGVVGRAAELVDHDPAVRIVADHLLGRTLVVEALPRALELARRLSAGVRLVTLAGELVVPGGPVTGGSASTDGGGGLLARRRELRDLAERARKLQGQLAEAEQAALAVAAQVEAIEEQLAAARAAAQEEEVALARQRQLQQSLAKDLERLEKSIALNLEERAEAEAAAAQAAQRLAGLQEEVAALEAREDELRQALADLTEQSRREEEGRRRRQDALSEQRARLAAQEEALRGLQREREQLTAQHAAVGEEEARLAREEAALTAERERLVAEARRLATLLPEAEAAAAAARERVAGAMAALDGTKAQSASAESARQAAAKAAESAREHVWAMEAEHGRHQAALESLAERMAELGVAPEQAAELAAGGDGSPREIQRLQAELEALGAVNLAASEELAELEQRLAFLREQQADLERAAGSLEEAIARLDRISEERFTATLEQVASAFDAMFQQLFGGGRAQLSLVPPDGGVDVHVQLPGRRIQHLLALSGGERALTAIALLFAMLRVNPSPFYVLDEIDAALDEANLSRFRRLLEDAARTAQFIVITHRATTMEAATVLYGVTAAQPGVSTLVSLDLKQAQAQVTSA